MSTFSAQDIRNKFIQFFEKHQHIKIESSPLIPQNDSTLLFANAGMNQFKDYFTGRATPNNKRVVTIQKCVRAGGKHNDLENVGLTARHHTYFEMLGNFSFGDYFKQMAISLSWEFLTKELKIPKEKLYVTIHHTDDEALNIWNKEQQVPIDRIFKRGDKDNFWEMGETGPCGPCSEIFYDHGASHATENFKPGSNQSILDDEQRYVEIWNLVFMQFEKTKDGIQSLPNPSIDTGAGLERLAAALQNKYWNYDTDLFSPIIHKIELLSHKKYNDPKYQTSIRIVADHIRSATMLITDGVIPSNEGRGYVLRRIIRRAVRHLRELECNELILHQLVPVVFESLGHFYPTNETNSALAQKFLQLEEKKFLETLDSGIKFLNHELSILSDKKLPGNIAFKLYDTFGFPVDLTETIVTERGLNLDHEGFNQAMEHQKKISRASWKGGGPELNKEEFFKIKEKKGETQFLGYESLIVEAKLLKKVQQNKDSSCYLIFDKTSFYGESGGQAGDQGEILENNHVISHIIDTQKPVEGLFVHFSEDADALEEGKTYTLRVLSQKRELTKRNHSATHLLQAALIKVLGNHVKQAGSLVNDEKLRFDFTHPEKLTESQRKQVQDLVNQIIQKQLSVKANIMTKDEAMKMGALAFFGEKYGEKVRVLKMGDFSTEFCGGTHVENTGEIGLFSIISEASLSSGIRRIEAVTSTGALNRLQSRSNLLEKIEAVLEVGQDTLMDKLVNIVQEIKNKNKEIDSLKNKIINIESESLIGNPITLKDGLVFKSIELPKDSDLRKISDIFISKYPKGILFAYIIQEDVASVLLRVGKEVKTINCGKILKTLLEKYNGRGGGRNDMAQGSCSAHQIKSLSINISEEVKGSL